MKDQVPRSKILEHSLRQTRQWKKLMHLGEAEYFFTKYSDVKEKKYKLPVYRKYDKAKFEKNVKKQQRRLFQNQEMQV